MEEFGYEPSEKALQPNPGLYRKKYDFPFDKIGVGRSWPVGIGEVKTIGVLRTLANRMGKKLGKKFRIIDHGEKGYEIHCVSLRDEVKEE